MKISDIRNELKRINVLENPIKISGTAIEMLQSAGLMENDKRIPLQNIDNIIAQDETKSKPGKPWFNTIPFGTPSDTLPYLLAVCRGKSTLNTILQKIKQQCSKMVKKYPEKDTEKIVVLLTDKWDNNTFEKYDKYFLEHALKDKFRFIILLVTAYGYTQIPFLPNDRNALKEYSNEDVEDDLTIDDVYELLEPFNYAFEYTSRGGSWDPHISKKYVFDLRYMEWHKMSMYDKDKDENGKISEKALLQFIDSVLWIKDIKESKREVNYRTSNPYISTLHIFGKEVEWDKTGGSVVKLINELNNNIEKFIKACEKTRGR